MSDPWRVLALPPAPQPMLDALLGEGSWSLRLPEERTQAAVLAAAAGAEIIVGDWEHRLRIDTAVLAAAPELAFVQQPAAGTETIDLAGCAAQGIPVANTGGANTVAVAEWCLLAALALLRSTLEADAAVRAGEWPQLALPLRELAGSRVGVLGMGRIGLAVAERFSALGAEVRYWSRSERAVPYPLHPRDELLAGSDVLVAVLPSTPETRGLLDAVALARMPPGAVLVNAGRGDLIDERALAEALHHGRLGGAALDVFRAEPLPADSPLRAAPRVLLSPHTAGATAQARLRIWSAAAANLQRAVRGEPLLDVVNAAPAVVRRRR